jgi:2-oxoglutarate dehydrogenase E2 component (dihydrolipoamide succinyltransferase)
MDVVMPQLGETVKEGTVTAWHKKPGETVQAGERLFEVSTDKVETEIPAPASGMLAQILVPEGETVPVGARLAVIEEMAGAAAEEPRLSPVVRKLLDEHRLDPAQIRGTGADGRITRRDVLEHIGRQQAPLAGEPRRVALSRIRKRTAEQMALSWRTIPHVLQAIEVDFHAVEQARGTLTYLPFVASAVCKALVEFPSLNATFEGDSLLLHRRVNLGIAVDLGDAGLIVPVVKDAAQKKLPELARAMQALSEKARAGRLLPDDVTEGTYTISNPGKFGTLLTAPIINPPQVAILSTDAVVKKPVVVGDAVVVRPMGVLAQSFDHRAFDGAYSAAFLRRVKQILESENWSAALSP